MIGKRNQHPAAEMAAQGDDQDREVLTDSAPAPGDLAAAAERLRQKAAGLRESADRHREEARAGLDEAEREAAGIIARAKDAAVALGAGASAAERQAHALEEQAGYVAEAARRADVGDQALERVRALQAEREDLAASIEDADATLARLGEKRQHLAGQHAAAVEAADVAAIAALRSHLEASDEAVTAHAGQRESLTARSAAIGDGQDRGELRDALNAAQQHAAAARELLNRAFPDRPEAKADAMWAEFAGALAGNLERIADERRAAQQPQRPNFVHY